MGLKTELSCARQNWLRSLSWAQKKVALSLALMLLDFFAIALPLVLALISGLEISTNI